MHRSASASCGLEIIRSRWTNPHAPLPTVMKPIRLIIVDDSPTMRVLIANALRNDPDIEVVGTAGDPLSNYNTTVSPVNERGPPCESA